MEPPLLAGFNKDKSDHKSAANINKSVHIKSPRWKLDSACYMIETKLHDPALLMLKGFLIIVKCPINKIKILCPAMIGLEKSFQMMYSNIGLNSRETVPLITLK